MSLFRRLYHDHVRFATKGGIVRVPLNTPYVIGVANSRGNRAHQEDFYAFATLALNPDELRITLRNKLGLHWDPASLDPIFASQATFVGIYDGHGGSAVAQYLRQELHGLFESAHKSQIPELYLWIKEIGGYFKRFNPGPLAPWIHPSDSSPDLDLEARATLAFFQVDHNLSSDTDAKRCGATASVAIIHSLDAPATPFFSANNVALTVAHCGDTRVLLCSTDGGSVFPMTDDHHPDARGEAQRLRRSMGSSLVADSFGETRWMGALQNTRCLGDLQYKRFGVTPEPEVRTKLLHGPEWAFIAFITDGISSVLSDDEVVDLARGGADPRAAAARVLACAQDLGGDDNATVLVVPLRGWGAVRGPDRTRDLREYRRQQAVGTERQKRM